MFDPFASDHQTLWIPFADILAGILSIFLVVAVLLTFHLTETKKTKDEAIKSPGSIMVEIYWKEDVDVDLWVRSPQDVPVGYSRKQGRFIDLLRDDLGRPYEKTSGLHREDAFARTTPAGEWVVNLHMFSNTVTAPYPIAVDVAVSFQRNIGKEEMTKLVKTTVYLKRSGQELTVVRFKIDQESQLIPGSINEDQIPLRSTAY